MTKEDARELIAGLTFAEKVALHELLLSLKQNPAHGAGPNRPTGKEDQ